MVHSSLSLIKSKPRGAARLLCAAALVGSWGCAGALPVSTPPHRHWVPGYVFGLWGKAELDVRDDCPATGAETLRMGTTWSTLLVSVATIGVYTPREVLVQCRPR